MAGPVFEGPPKLLPLDLSFWPGHAFQRRPFHSPAPRGKGGTQGTERRWELESGQNANICSLPDFCLHFQCREEKSSLLCWEQGKCLHSNCLSESLWKRNQSSAFIPYLIPLPHHLQPHLMPETWDPLRGSPVALWLRTQLLVFLPQLGFSYCVAPCFLTSQISFPFPLSRSLFLQADAFPKLPLSLFEWGGEMALANVYIQPAVQLIPFSCIYLIIYTFEHLFRCYCPIVSHPTSVTFFF